MHNPLLQYLDEVANQGSIRKAAKILNISSSAVNRQILKLELEFGSKLFNRTPHGVELTEAGRLVVEHCRNTIYDFNNVRAAIDDIKNLRSGHIAISTLDSLTFDFLPHVLGQFAKEYPSVSYTVKIVGIDEAMEDVASGEADIGIGFSRNPHPDIRIVAEKPSPFGVIVPTKHPLANRPFIRMSDCEPFPLVRTIDARGHTSIIDQELSSELSSISTIFYTNSVLMAKRAINEKIGIGLYTKIGFMKDIREKKLVFVPLAESELKNYKICAFISAKKHPDTPTRLFLNLLERNLREVDFT
ncbi:MAG: LysR family transcriptional regulator [Rhizobiales bacterium]|nr:LysR family transcriptional regulator [Hyphomicrobiales bacterium]NRB15481.1 LysR family transcriptional regulator [Hyphomicrobiales bacterium]